MTDQDFAVCVALAHKLAWPAPLNIGVPVVVDRELADAESPKLTDTGRLVGSEIRVTPADYRDLQDRCAAVAPVYP